MTGGRTRPSILADVFESVLAAIYLDGGMDPAKKFVFDFLGENIDNARKGKTIFEDYKTKLQELVQQKDKHATYMGVSEKGPEHNKVFVVAVHIDGKFLADGKGRSKKEAEQNAAKNALLLLDRNNGKL